MRPVLSVFTRPYRKDEESLLSSVIWFNTKRSSKLRFKRVLLKLLASLNVESVWSIETTIYPFEARFSVR
jgi:hypothetical protein